MDSNKIKIRASALGYIMVGAQLGGSTQPLNISEQKIIALEQKKRDAGKPLTEKQQAEFDAAVLKRDTPFKATLSDGAKTFIKDGWHDHRFNYVDAFTSKEIRKGIYQEDKAIEQFKELAKLKFAVKNQRFFENDYVHGTPDLIDRRFIADMKCPWKPKNLKLTENQIIDLYKWQIKAYQWLTGIHVGFVVRILVNPPDEEIKNQAKAWWFQDNGYKEMPDSYIEEVAQYHQFELIPIEERTKIIRCDIEPDDPALIIQQVELMRKYWKELDYMAKHNNEAELDFLLNRSSS